MKINHEKDGIPMTLQDIIAYSERIIKHASRRLAVEEQLPASERTYHGGYSIGLYKGRIDGYTFARDALARGTFGAIDEEIARLDALRDAVLSENDAEQDTMTLTSAQGEALAHHKMTCEALDDIRELIVESGVNA